MAILSLVNTLAFYKVIPSGSELTTTIKLWFEEYGAPLVAACSFVENIAGVNIYFPGSIVILSAMSLTAGDPKRAIIIWFYIVIPSMISQNLSYFLGRFSIVKIKNINYNKRLFSKVPESWIYWVQFFSTYCHPHFAAVTSMMSGSRKLPYPKFLRYFIISSLFWNIFWGIVMYNFGGFTNSNINLITLFYVYVFLWTAWDLWNFFKGRKSM